MAPFVAQMWHVALSARPEMWAAAPAASARAVGALCSAVWEGTLLAACVALGLRLMPKLSAAARSAVWLNVFALVAALHVAPMLAGHGAAQGAAGGTAALLHVDARWSMAVAALWAALTLWKLGQLAASAASLRGVARRATVVDAGESLKALLDGTGENGRRGRRAELCTSNEVERPCVIGFFGTRFLRPRVLIPEALLGTLSEVELGQVLLHEMEHVRRWDDWRNLAQKIGVALFPLNPALAWVEHKLCTERELACDDRVLRASAERKTYALCLARVAEFSLVSRGLALALGAWGRRPELVKRVQRILRRPAETHTGRMAVLAPAAVTLAALGCAAVLARSPQVVSFAPAARGTQMTARVQGLAGEQPAALGAAHMIEASAWMGSARQAQGPRAVTLKAEMPQRQGTPALARVTPKTAATQMVTTRAQVRKTRRAQEYVVLTEWRQMEMPQMVITVQPMGESAGLKRPSTAGGSATDGPGPKVVPIPTYEAVPFGNGWLIVQL